MEEQNVEDSLTGLENLAEKTDLTMDDKEIVKEIIELTLNGMETVDEKNDEVMDDKIGPTLGEEIIEQKIELTLEGMEMPDEKNHQTMEDCEIIEEKSELTLEAMELSDEKNYDSISKETKLVLQPENKVSDEEDKQTSIGQDVPDVKNELMSAEEEIKEKNTTISGENDAWMATGSIPVQVGVGLVAGYLAGTRPGTAAVITSLLLLGTATRKDFFGNKWNAAVVGSEGREMVEVVEMVENDEAVEKTTASTTSTPTTRLAQLVELASHVVAGTAAFTGGLLVGIATAARNT